MLNKHFYCSCLSVSGDGGKINSIAEGGCIDRNGVHTNLCFLRLKKLHRTAGYISN
jgi:hypothetical protein